MYTLTLLLVYRVNKLLTLAIFVQVNSKYFVRFVSVENSIRHLLETASCTRPTLFSIVTTYIVHICRGKDMRFENSAWLPSRFQSRRSPHCLSKSHRSPSPISCSRRVSLSCSSRSDRAIIYLNPLFP